VAHGAPWRVPLIQGGQKTNREKKPMYFIWPGICLDARKISPFFNRVFEFPLLEKRPKKQLIDKGKKNRRTTRKTFLSRFFSSPYREALNQRNEKSRKKKNCKNPSRKNIPP
jgi:hypothetical protein